MTFEEIYRSPRMECAHGAAVTIWTYTTANELPECPHLGTRIADGNALYSGSSPGRTGQFAADLARHGHVITECRCHVPTNHYMIGAGVGHDDAQFAESGVSMGAYYESGEASGGAWWEAGQSARRYYFPCTACRGAGYLMDAGGAYVGPCEECADHHGAARVTYPGELAASLA